MFDSLIEVDALRRALPGQHIVLFDVRHSLADPQAGRRAYELGHIPGAFFLDQDTQLSGARTGANGRHPLPDRERFATLLRQHGVTPESQVVVYDESNASFAARAWWLLRWAGHRHVAVLNGGWQAWVAAGGEQQTSSSMPPGHDAQELDAAPDSMPTMNAAEVLAVANDPAHAVIDARDSARYRGEVEPMDPVAGRIPGAQNRPVSSNLLPDGRFKPAQQLHEEFSEMLGATPPGHVVHYCGSGITACHNIFAMELAGLKGSMLYPGSWSEWCSDRQRPVDRG